MPKLPSFAFYPGDWLRNDVAGCSLEAQGLWLRMMMVMHDAEVYGELSINGEPMPDEFVAKKCGISRKIYQKYLKELSTFSVINRKENGVIYSGRMVKDEAKRQQNAKRQRDFYERHKDEPNAKPNAPSSSSSSSSVSKEEEKNKSGEPQAATPTPRKSAKPSDVRKDHPAIKMVYGLLTTYPKKDLWDRIIREIGDKPDEAFFRTSYELWIGFDGNPRNLQKWLFGPNATKKLPEAFKTNGSVYEKPKPFDPGTVRPSEPSEEYNCKTCLDEGDLITWHEQPDGKSLAETTPCPDCQTIEVAA